MRVDLNFLRAEIQQAQHHGAKSMMVGMDELNQLLAIIDADKARKRREFQGKLFGFVKAHKARAMLSGARTYLTVSHVKHADFDTPVYFTDIPPAAP